ncbi:unnamed protein product [Linum trigynum]|uniref:Uncharacterized protein n=1 Tax=Linum trigynum TaxID=586398 RepID=A0AAV2C962_9ROSI
MGGGSEPNSMTTTPPSAMLPPPPAIRSPWHSPVPYLFGGLAAMLGLIAFALLILACSYWRISSRRQRGGGDIESGGEKEGKPVENKVFEEKFLVIMAGDNQPTFLATPASNRAGVCGCGDARAVDSDGAEMGNEGKVKQGFYEHGEPTTAAAEEGTEEGNSGQGTPETQQQMEDRN